MTEPEKRARLNEMGKEIGTMYPHRHGSFSFDFVGGKFNGLRIEERWRPGLRPSGTKEDGF